MLILIADNINIIPLTDILKFKLHTPTTLIFWIFLSSTHTTLVFENFFFSGHKCVFTAYTSVLEFNLSVEKYPSAQNLIYFHVTLMRNHDNIHFLFCTKPCFLKHLFICLWLCWVSLLHGLFSSCRRVEAPLWFWCAGFLLQRLLLSHSMSSRVLRLQYWWHVAQYLQLPGSKAQAQ